MASNGEDISNNLDEIRKALAQIVHELKRMNDKGRAWLNQPAVNLALLGGR